MLKVELHSHTADDPQDAIPYTSEQLIDRAAAMGYDALAITLHDRQLDLSRVSRHAAQRGVVLIPGIERTIRGKHVLLLNFPEGADDVESFEEVAALKARCPQGLVVAPHPYYPILSALWGLLDDHAGLFDAVEVNGMFTESVDFNAPARRWASARGVPLVGNGDVHRLAQVGTTYTLVEAERHPDAICAGIAAGRAQVVARPHSWSTVARLVTELVTGAQWPGDLVMPTPSTDAVR